MNNIYQKIELLFNAPKSSVSNHETNLCIELINDYDYDDVIEAFIEFSQCIGFQFNRNDVIERLWNFTKDYQETIEKGENDE